MPGSYKEGKKEIIDYTLNNIDKNSLILDVGPGGGVYGKFLNEKFVIDCIEIFSRYIDDYKLNEIYNKVIIGNICDFDFSEYDLIIMGDVLEHIDVENSKKILNTVENLSKKIVVAVPYQYPQGEWEGNPYERHIQDDLTHDIMSERYPSLKLVVDLGHYGYYTNF
jgi:hypothetical protein